MLSRDTWLCKRIAGLTTIAYTYNYIARSSVDGDGCRKGTTFAKIIKTNYNVMTSIKIIVLQLRNFRRKTVCKDKNAYDYALSRGAAV